MQRPRRWLAFPADAFSAQVRTSDIEDQLKSISAQYLLLSLKLVCMEPAIGGMRAYVRERVWGRGERARGRGTKCILCLALSSELVNRMHRTKRARHENNPSRHLPTR